MIDVSRLFHRFVKTIRDHALVIDDGITRQSTQVFRCTLYAVHVQKGVTEEGGIKRNKEKKTRAFDVGRMPDHRNVNYR